MKKSQAFAALRNQIVAELTENINSELIPQFNAEVIQIREVFEKSKPESEALAMHRRRAHIADLVVRRDEFIKGLNKDLHEQLTKRVKDYNGEIVEVEIKDENDKPIKKLEAKFDDGSIARFPKSLWVNFKAFDRV